MKSLVYIGSPYFDGIGIIHTEAKKLLQNGEVTFLDGIALGKYPEIKNFSLLSFLLWRVARMRQFRENLQSHEYIFLSDILRKYQSPGCGDVSDIVDVCISDHCVCNNFSLNRSKKYRQKNRRRFERFFKATYSSLVEFIEEKGFDEIVIFNGRNSVSRILIAVASEIGIKVKWLECFGKKEGAMTYISAPFDIFDLDRFSDEILFDYRNTIDENKDQIAIECISDRLRKGDPLLLDWGVALGSPSVAISRNNKNIATFFFSSEDEYPAIAPSKYGLNPPSNQYEIFKKICEAIVLSGLDKNWVICIKLHPRYVAYDDKLKMARAEWNGSIEYALKMGVDLQVIDPLFSAYRVIEASDIVFSFGTTAWEATCMAKPAVLLGPTVFSTHGCCYIANSIGDIISHLQNPPSALPLETCYPYAWGWASIGSRYPDFSLKKKNWALNKINSLFDNRFVRG